MHYERAERILKALEALGAEQMLITDPMSIYYLTDVYVQPLSVSSGCCCVRMNIISFS